MNIINTPKKKTQGCRIEFLPILLSALGTIKKYWKCLKHNNIFIVLAIVIILSAATKILLGSLSIEVLNLTRWKTIATLLVLGALTCFCLDLVDSFYEFKHIMDPLSRNVNIIELWKKVITNPLKGLIFLAITAYGITCAQSFSEYYRINTHIWYDANLWNIEAPIFYFLKGSLLDIPILWDLVYCFMWFYIILVYFVLYRTKKWYDLTLFALSVIFSFFLTRIIAITFPTAGPAFYKPQFFQLTGTITNVAQEALILYMQGKIPQNGLLPGTMAMPSLHVGLTALASFFLVRQIKWTFWFAVPLTCLTWVATVYLGWHYALDGIGGIVVVYLTTQLARLVIYLAYPHWHDQAHFVKVEQNLK